MSRRLSLPIAALCAWAAMASTAAATPARAPSSPAPAPSTASPAPAPSTASPAPAPSTASPARNLAGERERAAKAERALGIRIAQWDVPAGCPTEAAFLRSIGRHAGPVGNHLRVEVRVTRRGRVWRLALVSSAPGKAAGRQTLRGKSCAEVVDAAALVVALAVDPGAAFAPLPGPGGAARVRPGGPPASQVEDTEAPPAAQAPDAAATVAPPPGGGPPVRLALRAVVGGDSGSLPAFAPGLGLGLAALEGRWRVELVATTWLAQRMTAPGSNPAVPSGADISLWLAALRGCGDLIERPVVVAACAAVEAGALRGTGFGEDVSQTRLSPWVGASGGISASVAVASPLFVRVGAEASAPLVRPKIILDPDHAVFQPDRISARGFVGLEVLFH